MECYELSWVLLSGIFATLGSSSGNSIDQCYKKFLDVPVKKGCTVDRPFLIMIFLRRRDEYKI